MPAPRHLDPPACDCPDSILHSLGLSWAYPRTAQQADVSQAVAAAAEQETAKAACGDARAVTEVQGLHGRQPCQTVETTAAQTLRKKTPESTQTHQHSTSSDSTCSACKPIPVGKHANVDGSCQWYQSRAYASTYKTSKLSLTQHAITSINIITQPACKSSI